MKSAPAEVYRREVEELLRGQEQTALPPGVRIHETLDVRAEETEDEVRVIARVRTRRGKVIEFEESTIHVGSPEQLAILLGTYVLEHSMGA